MTAIDDALDRFTLIDNVGSEDRDEACAMSLLAWVHGDGLTDQPPCAHPLIRSLVIRVNDADGTTAADRARIVRAGERGVLDTWWIPAGVILHAISEGRVVASDGSDVDRLVATLGLIELWKDGDRDPSSADLSGANLTRADLSGADLTGAFLYEANLCEANLRGADLSGANLTGADLAWADLTGADLAWANLTGADLSGANLTRADLSGADLTRANLTGAWWRVTDPSIPGWTVVDGRLERYQ